jgi:hypothetical protein
MCVNDNFSKVCKDEYEYLSDAVAFQYDLKQRDVSVPLLFNFHFEYIIELQGNREGLEFKGHISFWSMLMLIYRVKT